MVISSQNKDIFIESAAWELSAVAYLTQLFISYSLSIVIPCYSNQQAQHVHGKNYIYISQPISISYGQVF